EAIDRHVMDRAFLGIEVCRAHSERAARHPQHVGWCSSLRCPSGPPVDHALLTHTRLPRGQTPPACMAAPCSPPGYCLGPPKILLQKSPSLVLGRMRPRTD